MKTLYLLRHAKSSWHDETLRDFDRPLTRQGKVEAELIGKVLSSEKLNHVLVISSPALRARETTAIVLDTSRVDAEVRFDAEIYEADLPALLNAIRGNGDDKAAVIVIGHNPGIESLVRFLSGEIRAMPTAALAKISFAVDSWKDLNDGDGRLSYILTPKDVLNS
jgi:phosphohistidine phosphatase